MSEHRDRIMQAIDSAASELASFARESFGSVGRGVVRFDLPKELREADSQYHPIEVNTRTADSLVGRGFTIR